MVTLDVMNFRGRKSSHYMHEANYREKIKWRSTAHSIIFLSTLHIQSIPHHAYIHCLSKNDTLFTFWTDINQFEKNGRQHHEENVLQMFVVSSISPENCSYTTFEIRKSYSSSLQHACASRCSHSEWQKHFLAWYIWKVIMNLLNISFTEGVTTSHPKHRWWSWHLSTGQCTGSSRSSNVLWSRFVVRNLNSLLLTCSRPTDRTLDRLITAFEVFWRMMHERLYHITRHCSCRTWQICGRRWWAPRLASSWVYRRSNYY